MSIASAQVTEVRHPLARHKLGLLRDKQLKQGDGLWIVPCNSIHSIGMKFVFDAVFLDKDLRVVHLMREMRPWQISKMVFSAHSVPCRTIQTAVPTDGSPLPPSAQDPDPYAIEAKRTAALVAERVPGLSPSNWYFAFQSQGTSGGPWIGPTVEDTITALHSERIRKLVIQPIGFLCDHVEILYDIDIGFRELAANLGMDLRRPETLNASPLPETASESRAATPASAPCRRPHPSTLCVPSL